VGEGVALVTGASRGIGRAVALALAETRPIAVNYVSSADEAKKTLAAIEEHGGEGVCVQADVGSSTGVDRCFTEVEEALGPVDVLVNNAGCRRDALTLRMSDEAWEGVLRTNLTGPFLCARRALRSMLRAGSGRIVNVASVAGVRGSPGQVNYSAAKAGLIGLTKSLACELATTGVTVNAVAPGYIATDLTAGLNERQVEGLLGRIPQARAGAPEDVAGLVAWLCSGAAGYVTGAVFAIDGGMTA
jgi:3-oxoacyl-[acyl-carrier protein] reductase